MGDWIIQLYHKNDGYQAPIVINPMRTDGNIDINRENELVRARLLSNVLEPIQDSENSLRNLSNGREVESISLKLNKWKVANKIAKRENRFDLFIEKEKDIKEYIKEELKNDKKRFQINLNDKQYLSFAEELFDFKIAELDSKSEIIIYTVNYLAIKIEEVANRYSFDDVDPGEFINDLRIVKAFKKDRSHVMFKIRQTIYFLKYYNLWKELIALDDPIPLQKIVEVITKIKGKEVKNEDTLNTVELIPPPSFKVEFNLNDGISFDSLSSGEKQMIYSLSSVAYHLVNISSVRESGSLNKYHYVNLVFDEIELYYHPDWQRRYISELISYLKKINPSLIKDIHGVNFLFITHSPFILSDIPSNNVLKLDRAEGELTSKPVKDNTESFAANIHQLLANDFFMKEGVMGEFARQKLENVVDYLRLQKLRHDREELRKDLVRIRE
ncbi:MAG: hypothetical protein WD512_03475, partial [Candidatus Paceibacterota bacterium]